MAKPKTKLTPEVQEKILLHLRVGAYIETACACAGIHRDTLHDWMKRGAKGEKPFEAFADAVHRAVAESETRDLATILKASQKNWTAAAWRLERRFPDRYGRHDRMKVEAAVDAESSKLLTKLAKLLEDGPAAAPATPTGPRPRGRPRKNPLPEPTEPTGDNDGE